MGVERVSGKHLDALRPLTMDEAIFKCVKNRSSNLMKNNTLSYAMSIFFNRLPSYRLRLLLQDRLNGCMRGRVVRDWASKENVKIAEDSPSIQTTMNQSKPLFHLWSFLIGLMNPPAKPWNQETGSTWWLHSDAPPHQLAIQLYVAVQRVYLCLSSASPNALELRLLGYLHPFL